MAEEDLIEPAAQAPGGDSLEGPEPASPSGGSQLPPTPPAPAGPAKPPLWRRLRGRVNIYMLVFVLLIIAALGVILVSVRNNNSKKNSSSGTSLTSQQLTALKGNTTLVGDAKQTLDVQSNSIFEGQVLVRSDLNVAGSIKVGSGLSLPSITVNGNGNFGQLGINGGLKVGGDTAVQGQLTVQKNLTVTGSASVGSLSASTLSVTNLQLKGDLGLNRHIAVSGGTPGRTNGASLGSGGTASVSGADTAGTVTINTGGSPSAGCFVTINFVNHFGTTPHVVISPSNSTAATIQYYTNRSTGGFSICSANTPPGASTFIYDYVVFD